MKTDQGGSSERYEVAQTVNSLKKKKIGRGKPGEPLFPDLKRFVKELPRGVTKRRPRVVGRTTRKGVWETTPTLNEKRVSKKTGDPRMSLGKGDELKKLLAPGAVR